MPLFSQHRFLDKQAKRNMTEHFTEIVKKVPYIAPKIDVIIVEIECALAAGSGSVEEVDPPQHEWEDGEDQTINVPW